MTSLPPNADELVSAYLDGEAAPDEVALVEANPELMAHVEALRALTGSLGGAITPPAEQKERHLSKALDAFDELFADADAGTPLAAVPDPVPAAPDSPAARDSVTSLAQARERRKPRRFSAGLIAAAAAAVLLFVGIAALSVNRGSDSSFDLADTDSTSVEASSSDDTTESSDDGESFGAANAQAAEAPASAELDRSALSEIELAEPEAEAEEAMDEEAMADEEEAMEEEAMEEEAVEEDAMDDDEEAMADEGSTADSVDTAAGEAIDADESSDSATGPAAAQRNERFDLGVFASTEALQNEVIELTQEDLKQRLLGAGEGLFSSCQSQINELAEASESTWIATANVAGEVVEIHASIDPSDNATTLFIVDPTSCTVTDQVQAGS